MKNRKILLKVSITLMILMVLYIIIYKYIQYNKSSSTYKTNDINKSELILAYRVRSFAWGFSDYVYLISADGTVKYVNIAEQYGKNLSLDTAESFLVFDNYMKNPDVPTLCKHEEIATSYLNKIINIEKVKLKRTNETLFDAGYEGYYCISGIKNERSMICIGEAGEYPRISRNKNTKKLCSLIDEIVTEARKKNN